VNWSKEASGLLFVFPYWSTATIKLICYWIIGTMVEGDGVAMSAGMISSVLGK
jgi:hypothetical protein